MLIIGAASFGRKNGEVGESQGLGGVLGIPWGIGCEAAVISDVGGSCILRL